MGMIQEFKEFAMRGNVVDMAIGIVIGGAFGKIVTSLVEDIFGTVIGVVSKSADFSKWSFKVPNPENLSQTLIEVPYGKTITAIINFLIVAFCLFIVIKAMNALKRSKTAEPPPGKQEVLLTEIRDLLKARP
jgi:large conductance mechanosensitive channel